MKWPAAPVISIEVSIANDLRAEGFDAGERGGAVGAGGEIGEAGGAFGQAAQQCVTVADTFVAGQAQAALDVAGGLDEAFGGHCLHKTGTGYRVQGSGVQSAAPISA